MDDWNNCIVFLLAKAYQQAHGCARRRLFEYGLTPIQHTILEVLWQEEGLPAGSIGKKLVLDSATLSGVLDRMAEADWIAKKIDHSDKRVHRIYLAPRAREMKETLTREREAANEEILGLLSLEEKILLKRLLKDVQG